MLLPALLFLPHMLQGMRLSDETSVAIRETHCHALTCLYHTRIIQCSDVQVQTCEQSILPFEFPLTMSVLDCTLSAYITICLYLD